MAQQRTTRGRDTAAGPASAAAWGLGLLLYPLGTRRVSRAALVRRWYVRSAEALRLDYDAWFTPASISVVDALVGLGEIGPSIERFVAARAADGFTLADTAGDLSALVSAAPSRLRLRLEALDLPRLLALAWPEPVLALASNAPALGALAARVREACGRSTTRIGTAAGPTLLVIEGAADERDRLAVAAVRWIEELFPAAEVLGSVSPGRFLAVVHSHPPVPDPAQLLDVVLQQSPGGECASVRSEPWPLDIDDALALVNGLALPEPAPELVGVGATVVPMRRRIAAVERVGRVTRDARTWAASGIAAAVALAFMAAGGAHGPAAVAPHAAARPSSSAATGIASIPAANESAAAVASTVAATAPSAGNVSATALHPAVNGGGTSVNNAPGHGDGGPTPPDDSGPSPIPPLVSPPSVPIGSPPQLGDVQTQVKKLQRLIQQSTGPDGIQNLGPGLGSIVSNIAKNQNK